MADAQKPSKELPEFDKDAARAAAVAAQTKKDMEKEKEHEKRQALYETIAAHGACETFAADERWEAMIPGVDKAVLRQVCAEELFNIGCVIQNVEGGVDIDEAVLKSQQEVAISDVAARMCV